MIFTFFKWLKKIKRKYFTTCKNCIKFKFQSPGVTFHWNIAVAVGLCYLCVCGTTAELIVDTETVWPES